MKNINGCDSIVELTLTYYPSVPITQYSDTICDGANYQDDNFTNLITAGTYYDTLQNENGCDSIVCLTLTVKPNTKIESIKANTLHLCDGEELRIEVSASGESLVYQWYKDSNVLFGEQDRNFIVSAVNQTHSGKYYVVVSGICGDAKSDSIAINTDGANVLVEKWHDVILVDNSSQQFIDYQWYKDGRIIDGATEQFYQEIGGLNGCYSVELRLKVGGKMRSCVRCAYKTSKEKGISVYPNPANGQLKIKNYELRENTEYQIYSIVGQIVQQGKLYNNIINVETLANGLYFLKVDGKMVKFVKE